MRNTLKRILATAPVVAALALGAMAAPAQAAPAQAAPASSVSLATVAAVNATSAAAVIGDCTIKVNGVVIDRGYVTKSLCVQVANYWAGVYFPTPVTYTWFPLV